MATVSAGQRAAIFGQPGHVAKVTVMTPWGIPTLCHKLIAALFLDACTEAASLGWKPQRIDSYNPRPIRGEDGSELSEWSLHAWCLAWDFFATPPGVPPPGGVWTPYNGVPAAFAACFERRGFRWGGRWTDRRDVPHIEWAGGSPPAVEELDMTAKEEILKAIADMRQELGLRVIELDDDIPENVQDQLGEIRRNLRTVAAKVGVPSDDIES